MAESILNFKGDQRFRGFSAGSQPLGKVHLLALELLENLDYETSGLRSKSWDEFTAQGAPLIHFVITLCDMAAREVCPVWPGKPMTVHWGIEDPAAVEGSKQVCKNAFHRAYAQLNRRIALFLSLSFASLERVALLERLNEIGRS